MSMPGSTWAGYETASSLADTGEVTEEEAPVVEEVTTEK